MKYNSPYEQCSTNVVLWRVEVDNNERTSVSFILEELAKT